MKPPISTNIHYYWPAPRQERERERGTKVLEKRRDLLLLHVVGLLTSSSVLFYSALLPLLQSVCVWSCVAHGAQHDHGLNSSPRYVLTVSLSPTLARFSPHLLRGAVLCTPPLCSGSCWTTLQMPQAARRTSGCSIDKEAETNSPTASSFFPLFCLPFLSFEPNPKLI